MDISTVKAVLKIHVSGVFVAKFRFSAIGQIGDESEMQVKMDLQIYPIKEVVRGS